jgi:hypothetical protein
VLELMPLGRGRERTHLPQEASLEPAVDREQLGKLRGARQLVGRQLASELDERQRVPACFGQEPRADAVGERHTDGLVQQVHRCRLREVRQGERGEAVEHLVLERVPHRHQQTDAVGIEPATQEPERVGTLPVQPLRVVDEEQQRALQRGGGQKRPTTTFS